jgi:hypothetical protein
LALALPGRFAGHMLRWPDSVTCLLGCTRRDPRRRRVRLSSPPVPFGEAAGRRGRFPEPCIALNNVVWSVASPLRPWRRDWHSRHDGQRTARLRSVPAWGGACGHRGGRNDWRGQAAVPWMQGDPPVGSTMGFYHVFFAKSWRGETADLRPDSEGWGRRRRDWLPNGRLPEGSQSSRNGPVTMRWQRPSPRSRHTTTGSPGCSSVASGVLRA